MNSLASQSSSSGCVGRSPCVPKSSRRAHDAAPENFLPDAIHRHARRQRIFGRDQPSRQCESRGLLARGQRRQNRECAGLHLGAVLAPIALHVNVRFRRRVVLEQHRRVADRRQLGVQLVQLGAHIRAASVRRSAPSDRDFRRAEEDIEHRVLLHFAALCRVEEEHLLRVVHGVRDLAVREIPILVIAGMQRGFTQFGFVIGLRFGNLVLLQQRLALAVVLRAAPPGRGRVRPAAALEC